MLLGPYMSDVCALNDDDDDEGKSSAHLHT